jgi:hypothetical protein
MTHLFGNILHVQPIHLTASELDHMVDTPYISMVVLTIALILLLVGGGISLSVFFVSKHATSVTFVHVAKGKKVVMGVALSQGLLELAPQYRGKAHDLLKKAKTVMTLV